MAVSLASHERRPERACEGERPGEKRGLRNGAEKRAAAAKLRFVKGYCRPKHQGNQVRGFGAAPLNEGRYVGL